MAPLTLPMSEDLGTVITTRDLLPELLREVQKANPRMYARHEPGLFG